MCYSCLLRLTISKFVPRFPFISIAFFWHHLDQKRQPCICWQLQALLSQHLRAQPSEYCMCEVSLALNVQKHVFATLFVCCSRLNDQWVEVAGDSRTLIRNLWSAKMFGLQGGGIGSCRAAKQVGWRQEEGSHISTEWRLWYTAAVPEIFTVGYWHWWCMQQLYKAAPITEHAT